MEPNPTKDVLNQRIVPLLTELIQNRCVNDGRPESGQEIRSAMTLKRFFKEYGLEAEILEAAPGRANLVVRIKGTNPAAPSLGYLNHLDVVPVNEEAWNVSPFTGEVRGGYVWGRGTVDMLNMTATQAVAFAELIRQKGPLAGDLVFIATADEEASGRLGARWLVENHWSKVKVDYIITELGGFFFKRDDSNQGITITVGEKGIIWLKLKIKGKAAHGSLPFACENAAYKAANVLNRLASYKMRPSFTREYREMVAASFNSKGLKAMLCDRNKFNRALLKLAKQDEGLAKFFHAASQLTLSPNIVQAGSKINIIPDQALVEIDARLLPGQTVEYLIAELNKVLGDLAHDIRFEISEFYPSTSSPFTTPLYEATKEIIASVYPLATPVPYFIGGVTDGRFFRSKGTVVYGFSLMNEDLTLTEYARMLHGPDERISLKSLELSYHYFNQLPLLFFQKVKLEE